MKVKVLGTVSPYPKGKNMCVGYLIETKSSEILLDCGNYLWEVSHNMFYV